MPVICKKILRYFNIFIYTFGSYLFIKYFWFRMNVQVNLKVCFVISLNTRICGATLRGRIINSTLTGQMLPFALNLSLFTIAVRYSRKRDNVMIVVRKFLHEYPVGVFRGAML